MPAIQPKSHVLVTGGSGFIAIWCVYQLLERGLKRLRMPIALQRPWRSEEDLLAPAGNCVDVRDVAYAHVEALVRPEAGGNRFATSLGPFTYQDVVDVVHADSHVPADRKKQVPAGKQGQGSSVKQSELDGSKATRELGLKYIQLKDLSCRTWSPAWPTTRKRGWSGVPSADILSRTKH